VVSVTASCGRPFNSKNTFSGSTVEWDQSGGLLVHRYGRAGCACGVLRPSRSQMMLRLQYVGFASAMALLAVALYFKSQLAKVIVSEDRSYVLFVCAAAILVAVVAFLVIAYVAVNWRRVEHFWNPGLLGCVGHHTDLCRLCLVARNTAILRAASAGLASVSSVADRCYFLALADFTTTSADLEKTVNRQR
jgi:hypothetical protein